MQEFYTASRDFSFLLLIPAAIKSHRYPWISEVQSGSREYPRVVLAAACCARPDAQLQIDRQPRARSCHNVQHVWRPPSPAPCSPYWLRLWPTLATAPRRRRCRLHPSAALRCHKRICHVRAFVQNSAIIDGQSPLDRCRRAGIASMPFALCMCRLRLRLPLLLLH